MIKKLTAVILILTLLSTLLVFSAGASQNIYMSDAELIYALGISDTKPTENALRGVVTRGEFAAMMVKVCGAVSATMPAAQIFPDVTSEHIYYSDISAAYALGLVNGNGEGEFKPDDPIIYDQAMTMLVKALGYGLIAERDGGYPFGFLTLGGSLGLDKGANCLSGEILRYGTACRLIANAIDAEIVTEQGYDSEGNVISDINEGVTLGTERLKVQKREGIVTGNEVSMLTRESSLDNGMVEIDGVKYKAGKSSVENLLGYNIEFYVDITNKSDDVKPILFAKKAANTEEIIIQSEDILPDSGLSVTSLPYTNDKGRKEIAKISPYADLIYNGVSIGGFIATDLVPSYGEVELIDNNNDNIYEVVKVWNYTTIVAGEISTINKTVYDKFNGSLSASFDEEKDGTFFIYDGGERVEFNSIGEFDVVSAAKSRAGSNPHITAHISSESVDGTLNQMSDDGVYIDDVYYEVVPAVKANIVSLGLGTQGCFLLDHKGRIAGFDEDSRTSGKPAYGYLINAGTEGSLKKTVLMKLLTEKGNIEIINCAKKIQLDGSPVTVNGENVLAPLRASKPASEVGSKASDYAQIIRYELNSDGEIKMIDTLSGNTADTDEEDMLSRDAGEETHRRKYMRTARMIGDTTAEIALDENTALFKIPAVGYEDDEEQYIAGSVGPEGKSALDILYPSADYDVAIWGYDLNAVKVAGAVIVVSDGASQMTEGDSMLAMVTKIKNTYNEDGMDTYKLSLAKGGKITDYMLEEAALIAPSNLSGKTLSKGDIIFCKTNKEKEIVHVEKIALDMDVDQYVDEGFIDYESSFYPKLRITYGYVEEKIDRNIIMVEGDPTNNLAERHPFFVENTASVAVYNIKSNEVEFASTGEIGSCVYNSGARDKVAIISSQGEVLDIFIMRNN